MVDLNDLFGEGADASAPPPAEAGRPLADRLRPERLADVVGQEHLTGPDGALGRMVAARSMQSMIFWGPPGSGKTTVARLLTREVDLAFHQVSAIFTGVADLKKVFDLARTRAGSGRRTLLFVDEIHRFNKAQQDSFLPVMEDGTIVLVGATTENPSFELNAALLSRARVLTFRALDVAALETLLDRAEAALGRALPLNGEARAVLLRLADGDGRALLGLVEEVVRAADGERLGAERLQALVQRRAPVYDKGRDGHYNLISALHKSVRGSDPDAALYYACRILDAGEDPMFLARRLVRMASEDIGLADPSALPQAIAARDAFALIGSPEGELALLQACVYLAAAPKSNALYVAHKAAMRSAKRNGSLRPPKHILNAPTKLMREEDYGAGYRYDHDEPNAFSGQDYFPDGMVRERYYKPTGRGFERMLGERLEEWDRLRSERTKPGPSPGERPPARGKAGTNGSAGPTDDEFDDDAAYE